MFLALALGIALVLVCVSAALADDPMKVSMELSTNKFTEPKTIKVSITVTNIGDGDMPSPVTLYYPNGKKVEAFGSPTLSVGASKNWSGEWTVTQQELEAGKITFKIKYAVYAEDPDGGEAKLVNKTKNFSKKIVYSGVEAKPEISVNRTITPTTAQKGQEVSVTYEIANTGTVDITNVNIKENSSISAKSGTIEKIAAGETGKHTFTAVMGTKNLTSTATISYKAGGKTYTTKVEAATIKYGVVKLSATLKADKKGGAPGETVKLTLTLKNSGNVDFTNVTVTDDTLGTVFSGETVKAGETVTLEKEITITESMELQFKITAENATQSGAEAATDSVGIKAEDDKSGTGDAGESGVETATGRIDITAMDPTQQIVLSLDAAADREVVYKIPGTVRFTITVHNDSAIEVKNINIKAVDTTIYNIASIPAGESITFVRDADISMAGNFQFTAVTKDALDQTQTFLSNQVYVGYSEPTPVPTQAPLVTPPAPATEPMPTDQPEPEWLDQAEGIAGIAKWVFAGIGGVLLVLLLIGAVRRGKSRSESKKAMDHLEGATYRDYGSAPKKRHRSEIANGGPAENSPVSPGDENSAQSSELMAETLKRLYNDQGDEQSGTETAVPEAAEKAAETAEAAEAAVTQAEEAVSETATEASAEAPAETEKAAEDAGAGRRRRGRKTE